MPALLGKKNVFPAKIQELIQSLNNKEDCDLCGAIYNKATRKNHKGKTLTKYRELFEQGTSPEVLTKLEKSLREQIELEESPEEKKEHQRHYKYYIKTFLPPLLQEITQSKELEPEKIEQVLRITSGIVKQSSEEECRSLLLELQKEIIKSKRSTTSKELMAKKTEIEATVMRLIASDAISKIVGENHPNNIIQNQGPENLEINDEEELEKPIETLELSGDPGSRASSPVPSEKSPPSPVSRSVSPTLNHAKKDAGPQKKETKQPKQPAKEEPKKQENKISGDQADPISNGNPQKEDENQMQPPKQNPEEKPKKQENENSEPTKQPNNRNFRIALATGCALSAIGCLIAGVVTLGMVGAGLLVMSVVLAIAAAVTRYLTPPSSELTSTNLSPLIDDGKQR